MGYKSNLGGGVDMATLQQVVGEMVDDKVIEAGGVAISTDPDGADRESSTKTLSVKQAMDRFDGKADQEELEFMRSEAFSIEEVVDFPIFSIQPTFEGDLNSEFVSEDINFYQLTKKDLLGNTLSLGNFKLTAHSMNSDGMSPDYTKSVDQMFSMSPSYVVDGITLTEGCIIGFKNIEGVLKMCRGGYTEFLIPIPEKYRNGYDLTIDIYARINQCYYTYLNPWHGLGLSTVLQAFKTYSGVGNGYNIGNGFLLPPANLNVYNRFIHSSEHGELTRLEYAYQFNYQRKLLSFNGTWIEPTDIYGTNPIMNQAQIVGLCFSNNANNKISELGFGSFFRWSYGNRFIINKSSIKLTFKKRK